ncbi:hypothetical protein MUCCIDRAFT_115540 [Mucor lusitanicus CBS 277.49]|uniref:Reverse transcriptase zinc-binding domain-containing protein n=1 Tax=Mucor lusitanicus CBS 277.49 TaxID=747725 RepID=A0A168HC67_MUCCL|nr:hypothetical protein MUCCIDRAFT_115540 [Mucor lusitanicus CBS 277.49]
MPRSDGADSWMPDCSHWTVSNSSRSAVPVARLSLLDIITSRLGPPLNLDTHLLLSPASWCVFWSLKMPAKAFTPWWRLLHNRVATRFWCYTAKFKLVLSPVCALCGSESENLYHFVVELLLPSGTSIWMALTSFCSGDDLVVIDEDVLVALGAAYSTLWKYHWRCVIDEETWIVSAAINLVRQDHGSLFSSLSLACGQAGTLALPTATL